MTALWVFVTDCGDSAVTLPLASLVLVFLLFSREWRLARFWLLAIGGSAGVIAALKLAFGGCGHPLTPFAIVSPSGHSALSAAVYGSLALLVGAGLERRRRTALYVVAVFLIIGVALSRVVLRDHNLAEIAIGMAVGSGGAAVFGVALSGGRAPTLPLGWLLLGAAAIVAVMHGTRWMIEPAVHRLAWDLRFAWPWCR
jgi:membrane-associated phospholipid phosphatase